MSNDRTTIQAGNHLPALWRQTIPGIPRIKERIAFSADLDALGLAQSLIVALAYQPGKLDQPLGFRRIAILGTFLGQSKQAFDTLPGKFLMALCTAPCSF
jgi:hypothetical protein